MRKTHLRIMSRVQGKRDGWFAAVDYLRKEAGEAFSRDEDNRAETLRNLARAMSKHPITATFDSAEQESMERIDAANAEIAGLPEEASDG